MSVMGRLLSGTAPLRGRASLDLRMRPFDFRTARELHGIEDLATAVEAYAVIGGVPAYAREMVGGDLPAGPGDLDRWICERVGAELRARGLMFVGLDVIGDYLTEINVTSPTCIRELDRIYGLDIAGELMRAIERRLAAR